MIVRYFGYYFENKQSGEKEKESIVGLLDAYCSFGCSVFKNQFSHNDETVFLLKERKGHYVFLKTKDTEIIKTINKQDIKIDEIAARLMNNESVGFASHIYVEDDFIGFVSTQLAPTISALSSFINDILLKLKSRSHSFVIYPLVTQITRKEAKKMDFIGTSSIKINSSNSLFGDMGSVLGIKGENIDDLQSFEVIIRPKPTKNLKKPIAHLIDLDSSGLERFQIRAKAELQDRMADFRIESTLILKDEVKVDKNEDIYTAIERTVLSNAGLREKVSEYVKENSIQDINSNIISQYSTHNNWPSVGSDPKSTN